MSKLFIINGPMEGKSFDLKSGITFVGRSPDNDIQIKDKSISRKHVKIAREGDKFLIEDLKSQNGTFIDGDALSPGDKFEVGEGVPITLGNILISLGKKYSEDGMVIHHAINMSRRTGEIGEYLLYKDRRITDRDRLELIYEVSTILSQSLDIDEICEKIMDSLFSALQRIDSGAILLINHKTGEQEEIIARSRDTGKSIKINYSRTIVNRVIKEGQAVIMSDTSREDKSDLSDSIVMMHVKSIMCVPLIGKSEILGVIYVHFANVQQGFPKDDLYLLTGLSNPAAMAIENALLYSERKQTEEALQKAYDELEKRVEERTAELLKTNTLMKQEIVERKAAQEKLKTMHDQIKEANKNLGLAYAQMRDWKDRLSVQLQGEEIGFLLDENGTILGITDRVLEITEKNTIELLGSGILELMEQNSRQELKKAIKNAYMGIFNQTSVSMMGPQVKSKGFEAKLIPVRIENAKMALMLIRKSDKK